MGEQCAHPDQTIVWWCPDCEEWGPLCDKTTGHAGPCGAPDCWLLSNESGPVTEREHG